MYVEVDVLLPTLSYFEPCLKGYCKWLTLEDFGVAKDSRNEKIVKVSDLF